MPTTSRPNGRNQSGLSGFVELEDHPRRVSTRTKPALEDEAYRRRGAVCTFLNEYSEGSTLNALVLRIWPSVPAEADETGLLSEQYDPD